ncbi:MAG: nuclear transport factor 2 family protein [Pyrinomonadaceae bacterium]
MKVRAKLEKGFLIFIIFLAVVSNTLFVQGQSASKIPIQRSKAESEVLKVNEEFDRAIVSRDATAYERILSDDFVFTSFDGSLSNKLKEVEKVRSGDLKFEYGKSDEIRVKVYGKTAVVTGRFSAKGQNKGVGFTFIERYTGVFVKQNGRWQMVAEHASEIGAGK